MSFGAAIPVANEWRFVPAVAGQLLKVCERVIILRSRWSFAGQEIKLGPAPKLDPRIEIIESDWPTEGDTRNAGIEILAKKGCEYSFVFDSDEIATVADLEFLKGEISKGHRALACYLHTYWKSPRYEIYPHDPIFCPVLVRSDVRFRHMRVLDLEPTLVRKCLVHHLSYVRTDEEIKDKLHNYAHAKDVYGYENWFEQVWKKWTPEMTHLHPIHPNSFLTAREIVRPELDAILAEHGVA